MLKSNQTRVVGIISIYIVCSTGKAQLKADSLRQVSMVCMCMWLLRLVVTVYGSWQADLSGTTLR